MRTRRTIIIGLACLVAAVGLAPRASADQISTAIYLDVDTSGSMVQATDGTFCYGDGSAEHPHNSGCVSRMFMAKNAISATINGYPEVRWGLARFTQDVGWNYGCFYYNDAPTSSAWPCSAFNTGSPYEIDINGNPTCVANGDFYWTTYQFCHDLPGPTPSGNDRQCINYWGLCDGADILVALADDNEAQIMPWINHQEPVGQFFTGTHPTTGNHCWSGSAYGDCELRGTSGTPLAASLDDLYTQLANIDLGNDPYRGCRPYSIIMLTDGDESCSGDPPSSAAALRSTPDMQHTCSSSADCPPSSWCSGSRCQYDD